MTEKQHSEHTGRTRLLCILAMPPQARPHKTMAEAGKRKGPGGGTLGTSVPSNWCVFLLYGRPYPFAGERSFQLLSVIDPLTTDAVSLQFMDGMPAQKAFDMAEATCGKQLLSNTKAGSGGSAGGQARHRPQGR